MVGLAGANHAYDCAADRLEPPPGRRGARAGRACREGVVSVGTTAPTSGRRGMGAVLVFMPTRDRTTWCSAMPTGRGKLRSQ
jgi:hypothetical protein